MSVVNHGLSGQYPQPQRQRQTRARSKKANISKEIVNGDVIITPAQLIRQQLFKSKITVLRKQAVFYTLKSLGYPVKKADVLKILLPILVDAYSIHDDIQTIHKRIHQLQSGIRYRQQNRKTCVTGVPSKQYLKKCVNHECPYTLETLTEIPDNEVIIWKDPYDKAPAKWFGCDVNALIELLSSSLRTDDIEQLLNKKKHASKRITHIKNPYTRKGLTFDVIRRCNEYAKKYKKKPVYTRRRVMNNIRRGLHPTMNDPLLTIVNNYCPDDADADTIPDALRRLHSLIPVADAISMAIYDMGYYVPREMFRNPLISVIRMLQTGTQYPSDIDNALYITNMIIYTMFHGFRSDAFPDMYSRVISSTTIYLQRRLRNNIRTMFRRCRNGRYNTLTHSLTDIIELDEDGGISDDTLIRLANIYYHVFSILFTLTYFPLCVPGSSVTEDDLQILSITLIGIFSSSGLLPEEFEWARFVDDTRT